MVLLVFAVLGGCGGGGGSGSSPSPDVSRKTCEDGSTIAESAICPVVAERVVRLEAGEARVFDDILMTLNIDSAVVKGKLGDDAGNVTVVLTQEQHERLLKLIDAYRADSGGGAKKECKDGMMVAEGEICMQSCVNDDRIPEGDTCPPVAMKECPDKSMIPATDTCPVAMKECPDKSMIPVTDTCPVAMKSCVNGDRIPEGDTCLKSCVNGDRIPEGDTCMKSCVNGDRIPESDTCLKSCVNGDRIPEMETCPVVMQTCPDNSMILATETCPATKRCLDGSAIPESDTCPKAALIPPPNPPDGINYNTVEYRRSNKLGLINADKAYERGYFGQGVTVAVADTGVVTSHAQLRDNIVAGYDFIKNTETITDPDGHGTFVAGIIGAVRDGEGIHGVAPEAKLCR